MTHNITQCLQAEERIKQLEQRMIDQARMIQKKAEEADRFRKENEELKQALTGRTVSCSNCNQMAKELEELKRDAMCRRINLQAEQIAELTALSKEMAQVLEHVKLWGAIEINGKKLNVDIVIETLEHFRKVMEK